MIKKAVFFASFLLLVSCGTDNGTETDDIEQIMLRKELRVVTLETAISYYTHNGDEMGFDFALAQNLADYLDIQLKVVVANNIEHLQTILLDNKADFAAYKLPCTRKIRKNFLVTDVDALSNVILVQPKNKKPIKHLTNLIGKEVYVQKNTKYHNRLKHLNEEIGGGIIIRYLPDSLSIDEIIYQVSTNKIPFALADNDIAELGEKYLKNIDISMPVSVPLPKSWIVRKNAPLLADTINKWYSSIQKTKFLRLMTNRYIKKNSYFDNFDIIIPLGNISPYDDIFKAKASIIGWDWRLLASLAYHESRFNPNTVSSRGAMGIMQIMHGTGVKLGLNDSTFFDPEANIEAGARLIASLNKMFLSIKDDNERMKAVLAAYNAGQGHVFDAIALTKKHKGDPQMWKNNIEKFLLLKSVAKYYEDNVVKLGYYNGKYAVRFVDDVLSTYNKYMGIKQ